MVKGKPILRDMGPTVAAEYRVADNERIAVVMSKGDSGNAPDNVVIYWEQ